MLNINVIKNNINKGVSDYPILQSCQTAVWISNQHSLNRRITIRKSTKFTNGSTYIKSSTDRTRKP